MVELTGKYNTAKVFTDVVEETAVGQIINLCNQEFVEGSRHSCDARQPRGTKRLWYISA